LAADERLVSAQALCLRHPPFWDSGFSQDDITKPEFYP